MVDNKDQGRDLSLSIARGKVLEGSSTPDGRSRVTLPNVRNMVSLSDIAHLFPVYSTQPTFPQPNASFVGHDSCVLPSPVPCWILWVHRAPAKCGGRRGRNGEGGSASIKPIVWRALPSPIGRSKTLSSTPRSSIYVMSVTSVGLLFVPKKIPRIIHRPTADVEDETKMWPQVAQKSRAKTV